MRSPRPNTLTLCRIPLGRTFHILDIFIIYPQYSIHHIFQFKKLAIPTVVFLAFDLNRLQLFEVAQALFNEARISADL
jgi:hypothetical protein